MKVVILAGGLGTRLAEETQFRPKPMVDIGDKPIIWHIMHMYARHGFREFVVALGYKGEMIKEYFRTYHYSTNNLCVRLGNGDIEVEPVNGTEDWTIQLIDTGKNTMTGGRLARLEPVLGREEPFLLTYGDGVSDVDITHLVDFHRGHGKLATVTAVHPVARFGEVSLDGDAVADFREKPQTTEGWINGGFFVFEPEVFSRLEGDRTILEEAPLESLARDGELMAYRHGGFWQCMDTLRDKHRLDAMWESGEAPWMTWK